MSVFKHKEQRVAVFIDTQNLYHSAKNLYKRKVNFGNILKEAVAGRKLVRAIAYVIDSDSKEEHAFFDALNKAGIETRVKDLQVFSDGSKKADWDIGIAVDAMLMAPKVDAIILMTGDGDFVPLVEYLRQTTQIEACTFGQSASITLKESVDHFLDLSENPKKFLIDRN